MRWSTALEELDPRLIEQAVDGVVGMQGDGEPADGLTLLAQPR